MTIRYPSPLKVGDTVAVTAFSSGVDKELWPRLDHILGQLRRNGFNIIEGSCLRSNHGYVSAPPQQRADELMSFICDNRVAAVAAPYGGELATELLPLLNFRQIQQARPKWLFGYSDISTLTCAITCSTGLATVHSACLMELLDEQQDPLTQGTFASMAVAEGQSFVQSSSSHYQSKNPNWVEEPYCTFNLDTPTQWQCLYPEDTTQISISGRLFGGCLDTLANLFATPFVDFEAFKSRFPEQGVLLYLENVEMSPMALKRALLAMDFRKVFNNINGLVLGRNCGPSDGKGMLTYHQVITEFFRDKGFPVVIDADISHKPPNMALINGAFAELNLVDGKATISQTLLP